MNNVEQNQSAQCHLHESIKGECWSDLLPRLKSSPQCQQLVLNAARRIRPRSSRPVSYTPLSRVAPALPTTRALSLERLLLFSRPTWIPGTSSFVRRRRNPNGRPPMLGYARPRRKQVCVLISPTRSRLIVNYRRRAPEMERHR